LDNNKNVHVAFVKASTALVIIYLIINVSKCYAHQIRLTHKVKSDTLFEYQWYMWFRQIWLILVVLYMTLDIVSSVHLSMLMYMCLSFVPLKWCQMHSYIV